MHALRRRNCGISNIKEQQFWTLWENETETLIFVQLELPVGSCSAKYGGDVFGVQNDSNNNVYNMCKTLSISQNPPMCELMWFKRQIYEGGVLGARRKEGEEHSG